MYNVVWHFMYKTWWVFYERDRVAVLRVTEGGNFPITQGNTLLVKYDGILHIVHCVNFTYNSAWKFSYNTGWHFCFNKWWQFSYSTG